MPIPHRRPVLALLTGVALLTSIAFAAAAQDAPQPVMVGKGSYASAPPPEDGKLAAFLARPVSVEPERAHTPLPSNRWWTDLLISPYPGKLWAYPATVSSDSRGVRVWFPRGWNEGGTELVTGAPLELQAIDRGAAASSADVLVADFEGDAWPTGWTVTGTAWGTAPAHGALPGQTPVAGFLGHGFASSIHGGDGATGELVSAPITIDREHLHLLLHGGRDAARLHVDLEIDGKVVRTITGDNSERFAWRSWEVREWRGKQARLHLIDQATGGWGHLGVDQVVLSDRGEDPGAASGLFKPGSTTALRWGDWTLSMRLHATAERWLDVTCGRGLPYVWVECKDLDLRLPLDGAKLSDLAGSEVKLPLASDTLVIERDGRQFALFAPQQTRFALVDGALEPIFAGKDRFLVVALLPDLAHGELLKKYAFAVPRDSRFAWRYDRDAGEVVTTWTVDAEALRGTNREVLQGWLPHHWRATRNTLALSDASFATQRGRLRLAPGSSFEIAWPFTGLLPALPAPGDQSGLANPYDPARLADCLRRWSEEHANKPAGKRYGGDTYWGAKDFGMYAQYLAIARAANLPEAARLHDLLSEALTDWFTYTPGEREHFFARYPAPWKGLVGFKPSYGSEEFTDNHFHYGYFTLAAALLARDDAAFRVGYGEMAKLVAKQYANWDRTDQEFPVLRTFDPWAGHSYAGGHSSHEDGNNQESSSEAMQSWSGLFLLGATLGDDAMLAAGAMGYAIEGEAVREYWNDYHGWKSGAASANFPPQYKHSIVSVLRDRDQGFWTWFSGAPLHIYGIQWLPLSPGLQYLGRDPSFTAFQVKNMLKEQGKGRADFSYADLDGDWGNVVLGAALFGDADGTVKALDELWVAKHAIANDPHYALTYYLAHAYRSLGQVAWDCHASLPTSTVFRDPHSGRFSAVAWNPSAQEQTATLWRARKKIGTFTIPAGAMKIVRDAIPVQP